MKPKIRYWKHGMWRCYGRDMHSFGVSIEDAYSRWVAFASSMEGK